MVDPHGHAHDHGGDGGLAGSLTSASVQRVLVGAVAALAIVAVVGLVALWPRGDQPAVGAELGLGLPQVDATITDLDVVPCLGTREEDQILCEEVEFRVTGGEPEGEVGTLQQPLDPSAVALEIGDDVVLGYQADAEPQFRYVFNDFQRRTPMLLLVALFVVAVVLLGRWQGVRALAGLAVTGVVMVSFLFPALLEGRDPTLVALVAAAVIALVALYLTHGVTERTTIALLGALGALGLTALLGAIFTTAAQFTGYGTEDALYLSIASADVDIQGLVLAGLIIGSLGVLDDVTITQTSAVAQLRLANPAWGVRDLYRSSVAIGRDHIASTVNTLVLAYAGAALPLLLLFTQTGQSLAGVAVSELVAVEIVRTLVGSVGLVAAVPLTSGLAAFVLSRSNGAAVEAPPRGQQEPTRDRDEVEPPEEDGPSWDQFAPEDPTAF